jgi:catechol 2,3-dioxygenase-like lactoylglutathione lyase family enzyme
MPLDHVGIRVSDLARSRRFYKDVLRPLGLTPVADVHGWAGFGHQGRAVFWCGVGAEPPQPTHLAFRVASRQQVHEFFDNAVAQGAQVKSAPAVFAEYHPDFYAAMVYDPDGHNIEVVSHAPAPGGT